MLRVIDLLLFTFYDTISKTNPFPMSNNITDAHDTPILVVRENRKYYKRSMLALGSAYVSLDLVARDILTEPIDVPSHLGNTFGSNMIGYFAGVVAGRHYDGQRVEASKARKVSTIAGACAGVILNTMFETKLGYNITQFIPLPSTPDSVDFAYGVVGATIGGYMANSFQAATEPQP